MNRFFRIAALVASYLCAGAAQAQNTGTVSLNGFAIGNGPGSQGFKSLVCTGFAVGTGAGATPTCRVILSADIPASVALTGVPTAPTAAADTNTTQLATTAFMIGQASAAFPIIDGTAAVGTSLRFARADHIHPTDTTRAPVASPALTGVPTAPTAAADTNTTQLATTAYVIGQATAATPIIDGTGAVGSSLRYARGDHVHPTDTTRAIAARNISTGCGLSGGGDLTADRTLKLSLTINAQVGTSYTVVDGDCGKLVSFNNAAAVAVTLPQANGSTFVSGWSVDFQNRGAGTVTITPTTSTINGAANFLLTQNQGMHCQSDGTNYTCVLGVGAGGGSGTVTTITAGSGVTLSSGTTCTTTCTVSVTAAAVVQTAALSPASITTASTPGLMAGMGTTCQLTLAWSTRYHIHMSGTLQINTASALAGGFLYTADNGSVAAPANGAAAVGTQLYAALNISAIGVASDQYNWSADWIVTGATVGHLYWADMSLFTSAGQSSYKNVSCNIEER
jgi:hypothetical protein